MHTFRLEFDKEVTQLINDWNYEALFKLARRTLEVDEELAHQLFAIARKLQFDVEWAYDESINN